MYGVAFSPDGGVVATGDNSEKLTLTVDVDGREAARGAVRR